MFGKLFCFLGWHKWAHEGKETNYPPWIQIKCLRPGCKWVELTNFVTGEARKINTLIFEVK